MNIIFFGTSQFAVPSLEALARSGHKVMAVVTQPDRKKGRNQRVCPTPVKEAAARLGIEVLQPEKLHEEPFLKRFASFGADIFIVISYGNILKKQILDIPKRFCVNLHASMLPKYRGAAPINHVLINGESTTGVTVIRMNERTDEGDIILQKEMPIMTADTADSLSARLADAGVGVLLESLDAIASGAAEFLPQQAKDATYAPKLKKSDGLIDWNKSALNVLSRIKGVIPWPGAYTSFKGRTLKIWKASLSTTSGSGMAGEVLGIEKDGILVACEKGALMIEEVQLESSRRMDINAFAAGHNVKKKDVLG